MSEPELHEACRGLAGFLGRWNGDGVGKYPTIETFRYREESRFWHDGRPFLFYEQKTWRTEGDMPSHSEVGFWRPKPNDALEIVLAHTNGIVEIQTGAITDSGAETSSPHLVSAPTAKEIVGLSRTYRVEGDQLHYEMSMAFAEHALQNHLTATLTRTAAD